MVEVQASLYINYIDTRLLDQGNRKKYYDTYFYLITSLLLVIDDELVQATGIERMGLGHSDETF